MRRKGSKPFSKAGVNAVIHQNAAEAGHIQRVYHRAENSRMIATGEGSVAAENHIQPSEKPFIRQLLHKVDCALFGEAEYHCPRYGVCQQLFKAAGLFFARINATTCIIQYILGECINKFISSVLHKGFGILYGCWAHITNAELHRAHAVPLVYYRRVYGVAAAHIRQLHKLMPL